MSETQEAVTYRNEVVEINHKKSKNNKPYLELFTVDKKGKRHKVLTFDPKIIKEFTATGVYEMTWQHFEGDEYPTLIAATLVSEAETAPNGSKSSQDALQQARPYDLTKDLRIAALSVTSSVLNYMGDLKIPIDKFGEHFDLVFFKVNEAAENKNPAMGN